MSAQKMNAKMVVYRGLPMIIGMYIGQQLTSLILDVTNTLDPMYSNLAIAGVLAAILGLGGLWFSYRQKVWSSVAPLMVLDTLSVTLIAFGVSLARFVSVAMSVPVTPR